MKPYRIGIDRPALPSYQAAANLLEKKNGSGAMMFWWTVARSLLIGIPFGMVGVPLRQVMLGSAIASGSITVFAVSRIKRQAETQGEG